jgi:hypothetical protein
MGRVILVGGRFAGLAGVRERLDATHAELKNATERYTQITHTRFPDVMARETLSD